jgi:hypothetical protein
MRYFLCVVAHIRAPTVFQEQKSICFPDTDNTFAYTFKLIGPYFYHLLQKKTERKVKAERKEAGGPSSS